MFQFFCADDRFIECVQVCTGACEGEELAVEYYFVECIYIKSEVWLTVPLHFTCHTTSSIQGRTFLLTTTLEINVLILSC
jgi:hypothetical protein